MSQRLFFPILTSAIIILVVWMSFLTQSASAEISAAIVVSPTEGLFTDENGSTDSFTIVLDSIPSANVTIDLTSSDITEGTVSPTSVTFTHGTWDKPQLIEVTGVPDGVQDIDVLFQITGTVTSTDPLFGSLEMAPVSVTNINDALPIANDDFPPINGFSPITIPVLLNDFALDDNPLQLGIISDPLNGSYSINPPPEHTITYTPYTTFLGFDQFSYSVCDGDGDCATASVTIDDQTPPSLIWITPIETGGTYEIANGDILLEVAAADNFQVECVDFQRWDAEENVFHGLDKVCQSPYSTTINSNSINLTWNQVFAQASDLAGNYSEHKTIWIYRWNHSYIPLVSR